MIPFVARRLGAGLVVALFVTAAVYALAPLGQAQDPAEASGGLLRLTPEEIEARRTALGLDRPLYVQYVGWLTNAIVHFDLGESLLLGQDVTTMIGRAVPVTMSLAAVALVVMVVIAMPLGVAAAVKPGSIVDRVAQWVAAVGIATPHFVIGLLLAKFVAIELGWLPAIGYSSITENPFDWFAHIVLPGAALGLHSSAKLSRHVRGAMTEILQRDYVRAATGKGLPKYLVLGKHTFKNALIPIATFTGLELKSLLGGTVAVEAVFALPGVGTLMVFSVRRGDYPTLVGAVLFILLVVIALNLVVDLIYAYANPKVRLS